MSDRKKLVKQTVGWGIVTLAAYLLVFTNQETVTDYLTRGGAFAILVIVTALVFSFIHGAFANYLLEAIGIKPLKEKEGK